MAENSKNNNKYVKIIIVTSSNKLLRPEDIIEGYIMYSKNITNVNLHKEFTKLKSQFDELNGEVDVLKKDVAVLKNDVAVLKNNVAELKKDVAELKSLVIEIKTIVIEGFKRQDKINNEIKSEIAKIKKCVGMK